MKRLSLFLGVILIVSLAGWAQDTATIVGTVTDTSGAVIPGAKITVANPDKGFTRELVSNVGGEYSAPKIPIGTYVITAVAPGFRKLLRSGITVQVGQTLRVDLQLTVGQLSQEVTVTAATTKVQTETGELSDAVSSTQIQNMMLNGRNFSALYLLVPGAAPDDSFDSTQVGIAGGAYISYNGNRMEYVNQEIDGGNNTDEGSGPDSIDTYPSVDSIAEFRVTTSNYGADMGRHAGAQIEVATKSGTKDFHGDAYEYVRNDHLDANDWFINRTPWPSLDVNANCNGNPAGPCDAPKTPLKWNDFGYTLGGPFYIPHLYNTGKDKTFFFWSEEWRRYRQGSVISNGVPSIRQRSGDFSECDPSSPNFSSIVNGGPPGQGSCVLPTDPVTGNTVDTVPVDPDATILLNSLVPYPNSGPANYTKAASTPINWREEQIRVDQNISDKAALFLRFTNDAWNTNWADTGGWTWSSFDSESTQFFGPAKSAVFHYTYNFKPNLLNEFVMGYSVDHIRLIPFVGPGSPAHSITKPSGWTANNLFPANASNPLLPSIGVCGGGPCFAEDQGNYTPWFNANPVITWKDNIAWMVGKQTLKFGFYLAKDRKNEQFGYNTQGYMTFANTGPNTTGNALADMFLGRIEQYQEGTTTLNGVPVGGYSKGHWRGTDLDYYFQDDWKVNRKLTLNLGARYYYFVPIHDVSHPQTIDSGFEPQMYNPAAEAQLNTDGSINAASGHFYTTFGNGLVECGANGIAKGCRQPYYNTIAPRFGFAFDPTGNGKTSFRGGYGLFYEPGNGNESNTEGGEGNPPVSLSPSGYNIIGFNNIVPGSYGPTGYTSIPYHEKWGEVQQYSLSVQHEFPGNNLFSLAYVGTLGRHLGTERNINQIPVGVTTVNVPSLAGTTGCDASGNCDVQSILINQVQTETSFFAPYPTYGTLNVKQDSAVSIYQGLQAEYRHTIGHGLTLQTSYTWSHNIDDSTSTYFQSNGGPGGVDANYDLRRWRATSSLNRAQVLTMNYIYELPFFKHASNGFVRQGMGGWRISGITSMFTGEPMDFGCGVNGFSTGIGTGVRCNSIGKVKIHKGMVDDALYGPTPSWFDPNTYTQPLESQLAANDEPGMFGYMGRNPLTGPGANNWDIALFKEFNLPWTGAEHSTLQFRWETFNTFNHPQWNAASSSGVSLGCPGSVSFGEPCGPGFGQPGYSVGIGEVSAARPPRIMQFALKFIF